MRLRGSSLVHEGQKFLVEIARDGIEPGMQGLLADMEQVRESKELVIEDGLLAVLDFGDGTAADVQAFELKLGRELLLRPSTLASESPNLRTYDVTFLHWPDCSFRNQAGFLSLKNRMHGR